jgi:glutathione S-transferase
MSRKGPTVRLYYHWKSICSSMVYLHLLEKQITDCEFVHVDITRGEQIEPWFITLNPKGQVPVLVDGDRVVPDSLAISFYLESEGARGRSLLWPEIVAHCTQRLRALHDINYFAITAPGVSWMSSGFMERGAQMASRVEQLMKDNPQLAEHYAKRLRAFGEEKLSVLRDPDAPRLNWDKTEQELAALEELCGMHAGPWLFGAEFSVLDAHVIPFLARIRSLRREDLIDSRPRLRTLWEQAQTRPSFRTVFSQSCEVHGPGCFCK